MSETYRITADLFTVPYKEDNSIVYAPRLGFACVANLDLVNLLADLESFDVDTLNQEQKAALRYMAQKGVLNGSDEFSCVHPFQEKFSPPQLTLFPTNKCNLRCVYCYASAGEKNPLVIDWHYVSSAIEWLINSLKERGIKKLSLGFHGGGEPLFPWELIKRIVGYAEDRSAAEGMELAVFSATNGVLSERQLEWIIKHFVSLNISFDGLPHVQDYHRPLPNGKGSFEFVDRTMRFLDEHEFGYGIRSTVSSYNVNLMVETIDFIGQNYKTKSVHLEPLFYCGRCHTSEAMDPDMQAFADNFKGCETPSMNYGIKLFYSGCHIDMLRNSFCGVSGSNFSVTPDGYIATCFEVTSKDDPKSDTFFIGRIRDDGSLEIDNEKRRFLNSLTVDNLDYCKDCFAKWHCAGECVAKIGHEDYAGARGHDRCQLNRQLIKNRLIRIVEGKYSIPVNQSQPTKEGNLYRG